MVFGPYLTQKIESTPWWILWCPSSLRWWRNFLFQSKSAYPRAPDKVHPDAEEPCSIFFFSQSWPVPTLLPSNNNSKIIIITAHFRTSFPALYVFLTNLQLLSIPTTPHLNCSICHFHPLNPVLCSLNPLACFHLYCLPKNFLMKVINQHRVSLDQKFYFSHLLLIRVSAWRKKGKLCLPHKPRSGPPETLECLRKKINHITLLKLDTFKMQIFSFTQYIQSYEGGPLQDWVAIKDDLCMSPEVWESGHKNRSWTLM